MRNAGEFSDRSTGARFVSGAYRFGTHARPLATAMLCLALAGCGLPLYLHKDAYEKETAEIKESVDKLDVETAYVSLRADAIDLAKAEDKAVLAAVVAARNSTFTQLIDPGPERLSGVPNNSEDAVARLRALVSADLCSLYAVPDGGGVCTELTSFDADKSRDSLDRAFRTLASTTKTAQSISRKLSLAYRELAGDKVGKARLFKPAAGKEPAEMGCGAPRNKTPTLPLTADEALQEPKAPTLSTPEEWDDIIAFNNRLLHSYCDAVSAASTAVDDQVLVLTRLSAEPKQISVAAADLAASLLRAELARKESTELQEEISKELARAEELAADPEKVIELLKELLAKIDRVAALAQVAGYDTLLELMQCGLMADLRTTLPEEKAAATAADATTGTNPSVEKTATGGIACVQGSSGIILGDGQEGNALVVSLAKLFVGLAKDKAVLDRLERVTAVILTVAQLRHKRDLAASRAQFEDRNILLLRGKLHALLTHAHESHMTLTELAEVKQVARGFAQLRGGASKRNVSFALEAYAQSWDRGKIPVEMINYRLLQSRRAYDVEVAGLKAKNYRDLIKPLTDALAAYGAGGITPEMVGQILGNAAIAFGIAKS